MNALKTRMLRTFVHTLGQLSDGIRIACRDGLTAGKTVDYVYRNQPSGRLLIGRLFDRIYLSHKAWKAVRGRVGVLKEMLRWAVARQIDAAGESFILDIASGPARYIQDVLTEFPDHAVGAHCWDLDERWLIEGRAEAQRRGVGNILYYRADAMDKRSYMLLPRRPGVVVASGFYDWFEDDEQVLRSLAMVYNALPVGGCFVFTIQTGHLSLETANELFAHFDGGPLRMKTRPATMVHGWAERVGFTILHTQVGGSGCYEVTVAGKRSGGCPRPARQCTPHS